MGIKLIIKKKGKTFLEFSSNHGSTYREGLDALLEQNENLDLKNEGIVYVGFSGMRDNVIDYLSLTIDEVRMVRDELNEALKVFDEKETTENNNAVTVNVNLDVQSIVDIESYVKDIQRQLGNLKIGLVLE